MAIESHPTPTRTHLPIPIARLRTDCLAGLALYLHDATAGTYLLYRGSNVQFTETERRRLLQRGVRYLYLNLADHRTYKHQVEDWLTTQLADEKLVAKAKARILLDTSTDLVNSMLGQPTAEAKVDSAESVGKNIVMLAMRDATAFNLLLAMSEHDYYMTTHLVNVCCWCVRLAECCGITAEQDLRHLAIGALLHDIGKLGLDLELLDSPDTLTEEQMAETRHHPQTGLEMMAETNLVEGSRAIIAQHHERLDGTGFPDGLKSDAIHPWARLCAIVDSFDTMICQSDMRESRRIPSALRRLEAVAGRLYDTNMTEKFVTMVRSTLPGLKEKDTETGDKDERRRHERVDFQGQAQAQIINLANPAESPSPFNIRTENLSRGGIQFVHSSPLDPGQMIRIWLTLTNGDRQTVNALVVYCTEVSEDAYAIGARFDFRI